jgi:hypothetical protein
MQSGKLKPQARKTAQARDMRREHRVAASRRLIAQEVGMGVSVPVTGGWRSTSALQKRIETPISCIVSYRTFRFVATKQANRDAERI